MRVGLLGGSFDPIHHGHLRAADWAAETFALDAVRFVPARRSPFKGEPTAAAEARLAMLSLAIEGNERFAIEACELHREPPSYTVDTLRELRDREPEATFVWIVGSDAARDIDKWREIGEIRRMAEIRVLRRPGDPTPDAEALPSFSGLAVSSSEIRAAVRRGRSIRYLVPEAVRLHIREKGLYR